MGWLLLVVVLAGFVIGVPTFADGASSKELTSNQIALWFHYEEIAMHFNQLIIQYRLQLMGGAGAIGAVAIFLIQIKEDNEEKRYYLRTSVSALMFVLLLAAAILDLFYYNKLLDGAVNALIEFETNHPKINMSTKIAAEIQGIGGYAVWIWYGSILLPLAGIGIHSFCKYCCCKNSR